MSGNKLRNTIISIVLELVLIIIVVATGFESTNSKSYGDAYLDNSLYGDQTEKLTMDYLLTGGEGTIIRIATWYSDDYTENFRSYLAETFPDVIFEYSYIYKNHYESVIDSQLSYRGAPDIVCVDMQMAQKHAKNRYIAPLSGFEWNFNESAEEAFCYGDVPYAVPSTSCYECIYYNKNKFIESHVSIPDTYEEFIIMSDFIRQAKREKVMSLDLKDYEEISNSALIFLQANYFNTEDGAKFGEKLQYGRSSFYNDLYEYMEDWERLISHRIITKDMFTMDRKASIEEFASGKTYMCIGGPEDYNAIKACNPEIELGTMMPFGIDVEDQMLIGGCDCGFAVNNNSLNKEMAMEVVAALATEEGQTALWKDRVGSISYLNGLEVNNPEDFDGISYALDNDRLFLPQNTWGKDSIEINTIYGTQLQEVLLGKTPLYMALMRTDIQVDRLRTE